MPRLRLLLPILVLLALANVAWLTYSRWGLITINSDDRPLSEIVRSIEKQGGITLKSGLDPTTKVKMHVTRVPLTEALETLSVVTDARWRLTYFFAQDKGAVSAAVSTIETGAKPEGWKMVYYPLFGIPGATEETVPPDPRRDTWNVKDPDDKTLQAYLEDAGRNVSAAFAYPESWNPSVTKGISSGEITKLAPKLASAAGGKVEEIFLLEKSRRPQDAADSDDGDGDRRPRGNFNREAMEQRMQAEINKLPADKKATAQAEFDERKRFFAGMQDLTPEQRRAKMEDYMSRPEVQDRIEDRDGKRDARRTPEQRIQRYKSYLARKAAIQSGQTANQGGAK